MKIVTLLFLLFLPCAILFGQADTIRDPFLGSYVIANSAEMAYINVQLTGAPYDQWLIDRDTTTGLLSSSGGQLWPDSLGLVNSALIDVATGDFNADGKEEIAAVFRASSGYLTIGVCEPRKSASTGDWDSTRTEFFQMPYLTTALVRVLAVDIDRDPAQELAVAYWATDSKIVLLLYDISADLEPVFLSSVDDLTLSAALGASAQFDLTAGDFDRDGYDEIVLGHAVAAMPIDFICKAYDYDWPTKTIIPGASQTIDLRGDFLGGGYWRDDFAFSSGDYDNDGFDELVLLYQEGFWAITLIRAQVDVLLLPIDISPDLTGFNAHTGSITLVDTWWANVDIPPGGGTGIASGDIDRDGQCEVVTGALFTLRILKATAWPSFTLKATTPYNTRSGEFRHRTIAVADLNATTSQSSWIPEIVVADYESSSWASPATGNARVRALSVTIDTLAVPHNITALSPLSSITITGSANSAFTLAAGDFDGDAVRVRSPRLLTTEKFVQPLVILNAPPIHYDILNGTVYDVCNQYPENCSFKATYLKEVQTAKEFSTTQTRDWSMSASIGGTFKEMLGFSFSSSYGEGFSKTVGSGSELKISSQVFTCGDDYIFATVSRYEFWEYPLYVGGVSQGSVLVVIPKLSRLEWFPSKDPNAFHYEPNHEVGNILSYMSEPSLFGAFDIESLLCNDFQGYTISEKAGKVWEVYLSESQDTTQEWSKSVGMEVGASLSGWGIELGVKGSYSSKEVTTHKSRAQRGVKFTLEVGAPDASLGMADYKITPLVYWSANGALVVDYAVEPTMWNSPDTSLRTWWERNYASKSDPSFILPWKFDPEKTGDTLASPGFVSLTKSIRVSPSIAGAGDTVRIRARVHNFSLLASPGPVTVRFYVGDPDNGGVPIVGLGGLTELVTLDPIPARDYRLLEMLWAVTPPGLQAGTRIYAVIDPDNTISEIHEDNNKGWTIMSVPSITGIEHGGENPVPEQCVLHQNHPNPFNPTTTIRFALAEQSHVLLRVYDLLGRCVASVLDETMSPGQHSAHFNAQGLASGVYLYRLEAGSFVQTMKMVLIR